MRLNKSKGNMYEWVTHTGNTIKGRCPHDCSYCYMKRWGKQKPVRLDETEFNIDTEDGNFIFVGSSCDMFAEGIPKDWIKQTLDHCKQSTNQYLFQTKNPARVNEKDLPENSVVCTTIETNRWYPDIMNNSPHPIDRAESMAELNINTYVTIEPIMDFDLQELVEMIHLFDPVQVNIGADSQNKKLPEPDYNKISALITKLEYFTKVEQKPNLKRLYQP